MQSNKTFLTKQGNKVEFIKLSFNRNFSFNMILNTEKISSQSLNYIKESIEEGVCIVRIQSHKEGSIRGYYINKEKVRVIIKRFDGDEIIKITDNKYMSILTNDIYRHKHGKIKKIQNDRNN